jgi:protein-disulfide isomerase
MLKLPFKLSFVILALLVGGAACADTPTDAGADAAAGDPSGMPTDAAPATVVGEVGGKPITLEELKHAAAARLAQQQSTYRQRRLDLDLEYRRGQQQALEEELRHLLDQQSISLEAAAENTNALALVGTVHVPDVTDEQVRARYESRKVESSPPFERVAAEIRNSLQQEQTASTMEAWYASLRTKYQAQPLLEPLREPVKAEGPARGPGNAPITIVEFADFQCPFCRRMEQTLHSLIERYPRQIRLVYRNYPLTDIHPEAWHAAQAAVCAGRQGKFWEMHDAVFSDSAPLGIASLRTIATRVGLDASAFETCVRSEEVNTSIRADRSAADALGVRATPTLFINGRFVQGGVTEEQLAAVIDDELKRIRTRAGTATVAR